LRSEGESARASARETMLIVIAPGNIDHRKPLVSRAYRRRGIPTAMKPFQSACTPNRQA